MSVCTRLTRNWAASLLAQDIADVVLSHPRDAIDLLAEIDCDVGRLISAVVLPRGACVDFGPEALSPDRPLGEPCSSDKCIAGRGTRGFGSRGARIHHELQNRARYADRVSCAKHRTAFIEMGFLWVAST